MKKLIHEFQDFIMRGNAIDLAIGIIIGSAFSAVVNSIVENLMMPPLGLLLGQVDFQDLFIILRQGEQALPASSTLEMAREAGAVTFNYGLFLTDLFSFILLGFGVFLIVRGVNRLNQKASKIKEKVVAREHEVEDPTEKDCPFCQKAIPIKATRCPYCTSHLTN
jgi:large conductance mechanosensitive channel